MCVLSPVQQDPLRRDVNVDGNVTVADMLMMLSEFGCAQSCTSDLNGDGLVTVNDLLGLLGLFGTPCE